MEKGRLMKHTLDLPTKQFYGFSLYGGDRQKLLNLLAPLLEGNTQVAQTPITIFTPNPEQLVRASQDPTFYSYLKSGDILLPDGAGLVWAVNRQRTRDNRLQRITGREVFHELLELAMSKHYKIFLLGGNLGSAETIASRGNIEFDDGPKENTEEILQKIREYKPDLVFVAYGAPYQEHWIVDHRDVLEQAGVKIAMVVGGSFEYEAGKVARVPAIVERLHLEWLQRLILEPSRLGRQLRGGKFFLDVLLGKYD